jgi:hypothetical protein
MKQTFTYTWIFKYNYTICIFNTYKHAIFTSLNCVLKFCETKTLFFLIEDSPPWFAIHKLIFCTIMDFIHLLEVISNAIV